MVACSDGAHDKSNGVASHGWVFASSLVETVVSTGTGPVDGHPSLCSSYRAELSGTLAVLYVLYRVCQYYNISSGKLKLYWDNKGALKNAFRPINPGINTLYCYRPDLIELTHSLLQVMPKLCLLL